MSARLHWTIQDTDGEPVTGVTVTVHATSDDSLVGTMTGSGDGSYYLDISTSQKVRIKENGTTKLDNFWHAADDSPTLGKLASTTIGEGASLIGVAAIPALSTPGIDLQQWIESYVATLAALASITSGKGASLIGVEDSGSYYANANVEAILAEIGPRLALLSGLTASATELNALDGISGDVSAANLSALCDGSLTLLHQHDRWSYKDNAIGNALNPDQDQGPIDFRVFSSNGGGADPSQGRIILDVYGVDGSGRVLVRTGNDADVQTDYDVITSRLFGDFDLSSNSFFNGITTATAALLRLANNLRSLEVRAGINYIVLDSGGQSAAATDGATANDPRATTLYYEKGSSYLKKRRWGFLQKPEHKYLELDGWFKGDAAAISHVKLVCGTSEVEYKIPATSYGRTILSLALPEITTSTERDIEIEMKGDGAGNGGYMAAWFELRVSL